MKLYFSIARGAHIRTAPGPGDYDGGRLPHILCVFLAVWSHLENPPSIYCANNRGDPSDVEILRDANLERPEWFTGDTVDERMEMTQTAFHFPEELFPDHAKGLAARAVAFANHGSGTTLIPYDEDNLFVAGPLRFYSFRLPRQSGDRPPKNSAIFEWAEILNADPQADWSVVEVLDLSSCVLREDESFRRFSRLRVLALPQSGYPWPESIDLPPSLEELIVFNTRICRHMRDTIGALPRLKRLVLVGCTTGADLHQPRQTNRPDDHLSIYGWMLRNRLRVLEVYECDVEFLHGFQYQSWPQLEVFKTDMAHRSVLDSGELDGKAQSWVYLSAPKLVEVHLLRMPDAVDAQLEMAERGFAEALKWNALRPSVRLIIGWDSGG